MYYKCHKGVKFFIKVTSGKYYEPSMGHYF
uniref:Uncharacterized protein n=1 Tax=Anguilla anguilla TaxID=7936 RepID=A0A0E9SR58_ANGAN